MSRFNSKPGAWGFAASLLAFSLAVSGCQARGTDIAAAYDPPVQVDRQQTVNYSFLRTNYLDAQCIRCHSEYRTEAGLLRDVVPGNPQASPLYLEVETSRMPPGAPKPAAATLSLLSRYITGLGVINEPPAPTPTPSSTPPPVFTPVTFATLKQKILAPSCLACHDDMATETGLAPYVKPGDPEHSSLYLSMVKGRMPPGLDQPVPAADSGIVRDYILGLP